MKNGKVTFADFEKFMKFLGLWEEYKLQAKTLSGVKSFKHIAQHMREDYVRDAFDWDDTNNFNLWKTVCDMWLDYVYLKEKRWQK